MINKQAQQSGDNSTNIQAHQVSIHSGLTYLDVKAVALDVFRSNFYELAGKAQEIARARAEEITVEFLEKLQRENPSGFSHSEDPNFQQALFTVQKEYAVTGDKELGDLLVGLLVDRSKHEQRSFLQIVLNESLLTASKLTDNQLAVLAIIFLFRYTQDFSVVSDQKLGDYFDLHVLPFADKLSKKDSEYQHLVFSGCVSINITQITLGEIFLKTYKGLFFQGFTSEEANNRKIEISLDHPIFTPCLNDRSKSQINALNEARLEIMLAIASIDHLSNKTIGPSDRTKILALFNENLMSREEVTKKCVSIRPYMEDVFSTWDSSLMKNATLTSVGTCIAHANIKRLVGEFADLSTWIN